MRVLGISFGFHDSAAAIVVDGEVLAAAEQERFTRIKHDSAFPNKAAAFCLEFAGIKPAQLDAVAYYEQPLLKFSRILRSAQAQFPASKQYFDNTLTSWLQMRKFDVRDRIAEELEISADRIHYVNHHDSHLAAGFYCSPFQDAAILSLDGVGEFETAAWARGAGTSIDRIGSLDLPNSLGLFYSAFTAYLGFQVNEGEYKVMGMAGYGEPRLTEELLSLFALRDDGGFELNQKYFNFTTAEEFPFEQSLVELFGPPRVPESPFCLSREEIESCPEEKVDEVIERSRFYADVAASVQRCTEEIILHVVKNTVKQAGSENLCFAGGVALNGLANRRIMRELGVGLYVHPAAGDSGSAVGAALWLGHTILKQPRCVPMSNVYLGKEYGPDTITEAISASGFATFHQCATSDEVVEKVAQCLADGAVVGWFQGRAEWGPRALGNRSILADPTRNDAQAVVNARIKFRERFRPFAPAVAIEEVSQYFDCGPITSELAPEYFMLAVHKVLEKERERIPAVVHVDGTSRVQVVSRDSNPLFYRLIREFERLKGVPILLNTSFNLRGEPIVNSPADALNTFVLSGLDVLVLGHFIIHKNPNP